jgi:UDP-N-acetylglucosamine:LPS N-acetylglucosamine transferase
MKRGILAVSSSGGHWQQLLLVSEALDDASPVFVTTKSELLHQAGKLTGLVVRDCNRDRPLQTLQCVLQCTRIVFMLRPRVVISTGAAPGLICVTLGRLIGAETIWIDSFANVEKLSMSGRLARYICRHWITQWEHLSEKDGPAFHGALL